MGMQLIFCLETNKQAKTDWVYIKETIKRFYPSISSVDIKLSPVYMGSKSKYNAKDTYKAVKDLVERYKGESYTIVCIDTDNFNSNYDDQKLNDLIKEYCSKNGYDLVWFCRDIEEVYIGQKISKDQKVKCAAAFRNNTIIDEIDEEKLRALFFKKGYSNILLILDKYLLLSGI